MLISLKDFHHIKKENFGCAISHLFFVIGTSKKVIEV